MSASLTIPKLDLSELPGHSRQNSSDSEYPNVSGICSPTPSKRNGLRVQFNRLIKISYTFAPEEYDRNPVEPPPMTAKDYYDYQVWAFEMHQAIRFETTMRQLGLWNNPTPIADSLPSLVPTIPALTATFCDRLNVSSGLPQSAADSEDDYESDNQSQTSSDGVSPTPDRLSAGCNGHEDPYQHTFPILSDSYSPVARSL